MPVKSQPVSTRLDVAMALGHRDEVAGVGGGNAKVELPVVNMHRADPGRLGGELDTEAESEDSESEVEFDSGSHSESDLES